jgi:hypothetical protein
MINAFRLNGTFPEGRGAATAAKDAAGRGAMFMWNVPQVGNDRPGANSH